MMVNQQSESRNLSVELNDGNNLASMLDFRRDNLQIELQELGEIEAYRRIVEFFSLEEKRFELMEVLGIHNDAVLEEFVRRGFTRRTAPAIEMVPVVFVAWASGEVTDDECAASISAIHDSELAEFPKTWSVVQTWLDVRPSQGLWDLWVNYMRCRLESMSRGSESWIASATEEPSSPCRSRVGRMAGNRISMSRRTDHIGRD